MNDMVALIDTNILIDYLISRDDYLSAETIIDDFCTEGKISGFIAAHSITNIFYILRKNFTNEERRQILLDLLEILNVCAIDKTKLIDALHQESFTDFEDCRQSKCAEDIAADYIITRNPKDFTESTVPVISPEDFVKLVDNLEDE